MPASPGGPPRASTGRWATLRRTPGSSSPASRTATCSWSVPPPSGRSPRRHDHSYHGSCVAAAGAFGHLGGGRPRLVRGPPHAHPSGGLAGSAHRGGLVHLRACRGGAGAQPGQRHPRIHRVPYRGGGGAGRRVGGSTHQGPQRRPPTGGDAGADRAAGGRDRARLVVPRRGHLRPSVGHPRLDDDPRPGHINRVGRASGGTGIRGLRRGGLRGPDPLVPPSSHPADSGASACHRGSPGHLARLRPPSAGRDDRSRRPRPHPLGI